MTLDQFLSITRVSLFFKPPRGSLVWTQLAVELVKPSVEIYIIDLEVNPRSFIKVDGRFYMNNDVEGKEDYKNLLYTIDAQHRAIRISDYFSTPAVPIDSVEFGKRLNESDRQAVSATLSKVELLASSMFNKAS